MTTTTQTIPEFPTMRHGHPAVRAGVILALCASLLAGFVATSSRSVAPRSTAADATSVACDQGTGSHRPC